MDIAISFSAESLESQAIQPFTLFRNHVRPALDARRTDLESM